MSCGERLLAEHTSSCACDLQQKKSVEKMVMLGKLPVMWACSWWEELTETSQTSHLISPVASPLNSAPWEIEFRKQGRDKVLLESTEMGLG